MSVLNVFNVRRRMHLPSKEVVELSGAVVFYTNKEDQLVIEYKNQAGNPLQLVFNDSQEKQIRDYLKSTARL